MLFVSDEPAMKIGQNLIIADLHIGVELESIQRGIYLKQIDNLKSRIRSLIEKTKCKRIIILGDLKHSVPFIKLYETRVIPDFVNFLQQYCNVLLIKGNHDGWISKLCPDLQIENEIRIGKCILSHGHRRLKTEVKPNDIIIIAHNHPLIELRDEKNTRYIEKVWVIGKMKESKKDAYHKTKNKIIIMPAFSDIVGGTCINKLENEKELLGPVAKRIDLTRAKFFLLSGMEVL
jgi:putative SbcD/Mre11-related phosphoesterase